MPGKAPSRSARIMPPSAIAAVRRVMWQRQDMRLEARPGLEQLSKIKALHWLTLAGKATEFRGALRVMANLRKCDFECARRPRRLDFKRYRGDA